VTYEYRFAVDDEEYPQGFSEIPEDELDDWDEDWDEEDDYAYPPSAPFNDYEDEDRP
jgi:hypothetical protein